MRRLKLLLFRKNKGLKQYEMAEKLGITRTYYNMLENGVNFPSSQLLIKFNEVFPEVDDVWDLFKIN